MKPIVCWALYSLAIVTNAHSQVPSSLTYLGIEHGLSNNAVTSIYQDHKGFMWFGTYDGLNRYDGKNFIVYRTRFNDTTSLSNNRIACISEDARHSLWVGTREGVSIHNKTTGHFSGLYYITGKVKQKIAVPVTVLTPGPNGGMLIGTTGKGLFIYNDTGYARQVPLINGSTHYKVDAVTVDAGRRTWVFVRDVGLCRYDEKKGAVQLVNDSIFNGSVLLADNRGNLWLGTEDGLYKYTIDHNTYSGILKTYAHKVTALVIEKQTTLWITSDGEGVFSMPLATEKIKRLASPSNKELLTSTAAFSIFEDQEGRKWIGTLRGGINILDPRRAPFTAITHDPLHANSLVNDFTLSLCEDADHNIWIGTDGGGLSIWNREQDRFTNFRHLSGRLPAVSGAFVTNILSDFQQTIWVATWRGGIYRYNKINNSFQYYACRNPFTGKEDMNAWVLYEDSGKDLWAGVFTNGPLYRLNRAAHHFEVFDTTLVNIFSMKEDSKGNFWVGGTKSLIKVDRSAKKHRVFNIGYPVRAIHEDKAGNCWIGTEGGGLLLFNRETGAYTRFTTTDGLSNNAVLRILEDRHGNLWISTFNGISKFDPVKKLWRNFSQSDGLLSNQFSYHAALALSSGEFAFGGIKGLNIFSPDSLNFSNHMPDVQLTGLLIDNTPVEQATRYVTERSQDKVISLTVPYDKAAIAFSFVAPEYSTPDKINYAYYMEGWDKDWNYAGSTRTANYTHLYEGNYTFRIKNTNAAGEWNKNEYRLKIKVLPPWYRTWWAFLMYLAGSVALVWLYQRYRAQQIKLHFEVRLARMEMEKEIELNKRKLDFFTNISHEFRTPLTLIINPVKEMLGHSNESGGKGLEVVYRNARRLLSLVDQLLLFRKAESETDKLRITCLNLHDLCKDVYHCFSQQAAAMNIHYTFSCASEQLLIYADREKIEIVLFNLLSNAIKFTPENGSISLSVIEQEDDITVDITDTGCGINESTGHQLFEKFYQGKPGKTGFGIGLHLSKQIVESHQGRLSFTSIPGERTIFKVVFRKGAGHFSGQHVFEEIGESPALLEELMGNISSRTPVAKEQPPVGDIVSGKRSILVVDDNPEIRGYLQVLFQDRFIFHEADNGAGGLQMAREHTPDIIISDVIMNGMNGVELCQAIRQDTSLSHIPVVLLTASPSQETRLRSMECGADDYILKPFENDLLIARIDNLLKNRNMLQRYFLDKITLRENNTRVSAEDKDFLERCISVVEHNLDNDAFNIKMLASEIGMSHSNLYKKVKAVSGNSVNAFIRLIRLRRAAVLLLSTGCNVNEAAFSVGLNDVKYFREQFSKLFGMTPSAYIKKYRSTFNKDFNIINWND